MTAKNISVISISEARNIFLNSQLLAHNENLFTTKSHLLKIIEKLGYVQIDTISVVERSHHHILWTRMPKYKKIMLDELVDDKKIFEYWSHAASYLPMKDFRYSLIRKKLYSTKYKEWGKANKKITKYVLDRIKSEGPLQSKDFEDNRGKTSGWWDWKPSKDALDFLFHQGKLMIAGRKGFQKVYELTEKVLPENIDISYPTENEFYKHLILITINAHGIAAENEITYQRRFDKRKFVRALNELIEGRDIVQVNVNGINGKNYFTTDLNLKFSKSKNSSQIHILSPFDNIAIQRKKLKELFDFDYQIECYLPEAKRKFGYFCLPVLYGNKFIGRIDAKASRNTGTFILKKFHKEPNVKMDSKILDKLKEKLVDLSHFTGCGKIENIRIIK